MLDMDQDSGNDDDGLSARRAFLDACAAQASVKDDFPGYVLARLHKLAGESVPLWVRDHQASYGMLSTEMDELIGLARERLNDRETQVLDSRVASLKGGLSWNAVYPHLLHP